MVFQVARLPEARCVVCGCTDSQACKDGCGWIWVDREKREGKCSSHVARPWITQTSDMVIEEHPYSAPIWWMTQDQRIALEVRLGRLEERVGAKAKRPARGSSYGNDCGG